MTDQLLSLLGLGKKGGMLVIGEEPVEAVARARDARVLLLAEDAADNTLRRVRHFAEAGDCLWLRIPYTKEALGRALGRTSCALQAVTDIGFAANLVRRLVEADPARYGETADRLDQKAEKAARRKSMYERETEMVITENEKAVAQSQAEARNAGPLAQAEADKAVAQKKAELATIQAEADRATAAAQADTAIEQAKLREAQLLTDIIKPAEAAAKERIIEAEAEAKARTAIAEGIAAHNGIALDDKLVNQMPEIMEAFAEGLKGSDLTVIGDGKDITKLFAEFAATVPQFRSMLNPTNNQATE